MRYYSVKTPTWLPKIFPKNLIWKIPGNNAVYLTFDDGPHAEATPFVLNLLKEYNVKGTFFCIGKNVVKHPDIYKTIIAEGHKTGNHSFDHLNGWKTDNPVYLRNILKASSVIHSKIFRPPYGRIKTSQAKKLMQRGWKIYMWDVLSADFDTGISAEECLSNVLQNIESGSIIVFHDSEKAFAKLKFALPQVLQFCKEKGWHIKSLPSD